jgi:hypothetical protein
MAGRMIDALVLDVFVEQSKWRYSMARASRASCDMGKYGEQANS